ncbi:MAG TPA: MFS transporter [Rectinemataceae bacterium]
METKRNGIGVMASYGMGKFLAEFFTGAFASLVFKYYETEIGLSAGLTAAAIVLYSVWNAMNDPLIGYLTARPTVLSARFGRRFPWIFAGAIASCLAFILIFTPPEKSQASIFLYLLATICVYDALYSMWEVNYQSIFPDKFRLGAERSKAAGIATVVGVLGVAGGAVLPTFFVRYGKPETYRLNAFLFASLGLLAIGTLLPGVRETRDMIHRFMDQAKAPSGRKTRGASRASDSFFSQVGEALKRRNFLAFILLYFFYQSATISMTASIHYVGDYLLEGRSTTLIFAGMLGGALAGVPVWLGLKRYIRSNQKLLALSAGALSLLCLPLMIAKSHNGFVISMFGWGLAFGGFWMLMTPAMADVIDEIVVETGRRDDGVYLGFRAFAGRLAYAVQALSFWIIHSLSGFSIDPRSVSAKMGIRLHTALIPSILLVCGVVVFMAINRLDADSAEKNRKILEERGL